MVEPVYEMLAPRLFLETDPFPTGVARPLPPESSWSSFVGVDASSGVDARCEDVPGLPTAGEPPGVVRYEVDLRRSDGEEVRSPGAELLDAGLSAFEYMPGDPIMEAGRAVLALRGLVPTAAFPLGDPVPLPSPDGDPDPDAGENADPESERRFRWRALP